MWILSVGVMKMNRTNRIRTFFCALLLLAMLTYYAGYRYSLLHNLKNQQIQDTLYEEAKEDKTVSTNSGAVLEKKDTRTTEAVKFMYAVVSEEGYLTVYKNDLTTVFLYTGISYDTLPQKLKSQIDEGMVFNDEKSLYEFLESYSS